MSNPAVIILDDSSCRKGKYKRFVVEDNIGEAIHLHIDDMRIDFTVKEFLEFSSMIRESLNEMNFLCGYSLDSFDEHFLNKCADHLDKLVDIKIERVRLADLKCIIHSHYGKDYSVGRLVSVDKSPAYRYLAGDKEALLRYGQYNYFNIDNEDRLKSNLISINDYGYPFNDQYITLFSGENIIRDGQHRAAILAYLQGLDSDVKIMRFYFKGKKHLANIRLNNLKIRIRLVIHKFFRFTKKAFDRVKIY